MKTLKKLMIVTLLLGTVVFANAKGKGKYEEKCHSVSCEQIRNSLHEIIKSDLGKSNNFFYDNSINSFNSDVCVTFFITNNNKVQLLKAQSDDGLAIDYISQLFENTKINVAEKDQNKKFRVTLKLIYQAL